MQQGGIEVIATTADDFREGVYPCFSTFGAVCFCLFEAVTIDMSLIVPDDFFRLLRVSVRLGCRCLSGRGAGTGKGQEKDKKKYRFMRIHG